MIRVSAIAAVLCALAVPAAAQASSAQDDFAFAAGLHDRGLHDRAVKAFENFLERWPRDSRVAKARFHLAQSLSATGRDEEALSQFNRYISSNDTSLLNEARLRAGEVELRLGRPAAAAKRLKELAGSADIGDLLEPALYLLGEAANASADAATAEAAFARLVKQFSTGPYAGAALNALGFLKFAAGEAEQARSHFEAAASSPGSGSEIVLEAELMLAECSLLGGDARAALRRLDRLGKDPGRFGGQAALIRARAFLDLKRGEEGAEVLKRAVRDHPGEPRLGRTLLRAAADLETLGKPSLGIELLDLVQPADADEAKDVAYWRGRLLASGGHVEESLEQLAIAAATSPRRKFAYGDALAKAGRHGEAAEIFAALNRADDGELRREAAFAEAFSRNRLGEHERAVALLRELGGESLPRDFEIDVLLALGENLFALKRYPEAAKAYDKVAEAQAGARTTQALHKRVWCAWIERDLDAAEKACGSLLASEADAAVKSEVAYLLARVFEAQGRHEEAADRFGSLARDRSAGEYRGMATLGQAAALRQLGRHQEAEGLYQSLARSEQSGETLAAALQGLGEVQTLLGRPGDAIRSFTRVIERHGGSPLLPSALLGRGWALRATGGAARAAADAARAAEDGDERIAAEASYLLALLHHEAERHDEAASVLTRLVDAPAARGRQGELHMLLGLSLARAGRHDAARVHLERVADGERGAPGRDAALYELAFGHEAAGRPDERAACLRRIVDELPESALAADASFRLANREYDEGRYEQALKDYGFALSTADPEIADKACYKAAWSLVKLGRPAEAAEMFEKVAGGRSELAAESLYLAGQAFEEAGDLAAATDRFGRMAASHRRHELAPDAACRAVVLLARAEAHDDVIKAAPGVLARHGDEPRAVDVALSLGRAYAAKEQWEPARTAFRRAAKAAGGPKSAEAQYRIGLAYREEGDMDRALDEFLRVSILYGHAEWVARATLASARLLDAAGEGSKARRLFDDLVRDHPGTEQAREAAAWLKENPPEDRR